jgi:hypothetical protein
MFQPYATEAGSKLWVLDLVPDRNTPIGENRRWREGDPSPVRLLMDYSTGVEACERNPLRYRAEQMPDTEYQALVNSLQERQQ